MLHLLNLGTRESLGAWEKRAFIPLIGEVHDRLATRTAESEQERKKEHLRAVSE